MLQTSLAYKFVTAVLLVGEVNYYAPRMKLPIAAPIQINEIRILDGFPALIRTSGGRIQVKNYSFSISDHAIFIQNLAEDGYASFGIPDQSGKSSNELMERASLMKYTVTTNDVYQMATNWIAGLDIDLEKLEKTNSCRINNGPFHSKRGLVPSPMITVDWKNAKRPGYDENEIYVEISAVSSELLRLDIYSDIFAKNPYPRLKEFDKLAAIPDEVFLKYSEIERSNLVAQFIVNRPFPITTEAMNLSLFFATNRPPATNAPAHP